MFCPVAILAKRDWSLEISWHKCRIQEKEYVRFWVPKPELGNPHKGPLQPARAHSEAVTGKLPTLEAVAREHITRTLEATGWQISGTKGAAAILGMNPNTLRSRMLKLGISRVG